MSIETDVPWAEAIDTHDIGLRLHPIDVGFDVRAQHMLVSAPAGERLRASYPNELGERWVVAGPRAAVLERLRALGFAFADDGSL